MADVTPTVLGLALNFSCETRDCSRAMSHVVAPLDQPSNYKDSQAKVDRLKQNDLLQKSTTLYVSILVRKVLPDIVGWHDLLVTCIRKLADATKTYLI